MDTTTQAEQPDELQAAAAPQRRPRRGLFRRNRKDRGFSLIEITASMAIIAILALAIMPQFSKYFERASVQNLSQEVQQASTIVESDYSLTGQALYVAANIGQAPSGGTASGSLASVKKNSQTSLSSSLLTAAGAASAGTSDAGYMLVGTNPGVTHYVIWYCSLGGATTPGLHVAAAGTTATCS